MKFSEKALIFPDTVCYNREKLFTEEMNMAELGTMTVMLMEKGIQNKTDMRIRSVVRRNTDLR